MTTLVIHPKDNTTDFLSTIYLDKDWAVITDPYVSKKTLKDQIKAHDRVIMLGHGNPKGLFNDNFRFIIDSSLVYLLREKECICIWCYANEFVEKYKLKGFYSGMIISEYEEALNLAIQTTKDELNKSNYLFAKAIKESIDLSDMLTSVQKVYDGDSAVINFNKENLFINY